MKTFFLLLFCILPCIRSFGNVLISNASGDGSVLVLNYGASQLYLPAGDTLTLDGTSVLVGTNVDFTFYNDNVSASGDAQTYTIQDGYSYSFDDEQQNAMLVAQLNVPGQGLVNALEAFASQSQYVSALCMGLMAGIPFWVMVIGFSIVRTYMTEKEDI